MQLLGHIAKSLATDPMAALLVAIPLSLAFDSYLIGFFTFAAVSRDIPNRSLLYRVGILWFAAFALIAAVTYAATDQMTTVPT